MPSRDWEIATGSQETVASKVLFVKSGDVRCQDSEQCLPEIPFYGKVSQHSLIPHPLTPKLEMQRFAKPYPCSDFF